MRKFVAGAFLASIPIGVSTFLYLFRDGGLAALAFFWVLMAGAMGVALAASWATEVLCGN